MSAAATAPSPNSWSSAARRPRSRASIRRKPSSPLRARGRPRAWRNSSWATPWRCPFPENRFDAAVMALVIFFVPDPAKGVAEMARVVRPAARSRPMPGTWWAADFRWSRCRPRCAPWASPPSIRRAPTRRASMRCAACGRMRASRRSRRGRSRCSGRSPISTTSGRPASWDRASADHCRAMASGRCRKAQNAGAGAIAGRRRRPHHLWRARQRGQRPRAEVAGLFARAKTCEIC